MLSVHISQFPTTTGARGGLVAGGQLGYASPGYYYLGAALQAVRRRKSSGRLLREVRCWPQSSSIGMAVGLRFSMWVFPHEKSGRGCFRGLVFAAGCLFGSDWQLVCVSPCGCLRLRNASGWRYSSARFSVARRRGVPGRYTPVFRKKRQSTKIIHVSLPPLFQDTFSARRNDCHVSTVPPAIRFDRRAMRVKQNRKAVTT